MYDCRSAAPFASLIQVKHAVKLLSPQTRQAVLFRQSPALLVVSYNLIIYIIYLLNLGIKLYKARRNPLSAVTGVVGGLTGGEDGEGGPLSAVTGVIGGLTGGEDGEGGPLSAVTGIVGGLSGGGKEFNYFNRF
ncbi:hypothetical protein ACJJTC_001717 [Scirpophaga incertulas]